MAHTYATVAEANDYITSGGATKFAAESAAIVALKLSILESVSRVRRLQVTGGLRHRTCIRGRERSGCSGGCGDPSRPCGAGS